MQQLRDIVAVAARLSEQIGPQAAETIAERADQHLAEGLTEDAAFWRDVARAIALLSAISTPAHDPAEPPAVRRELLAERALAYVARAMEAERKATLGSDAFRREMIDAALQWRDLAHQAQLLAGTLPGPARAVEPASAAPPRS
jgi:hypothetical protein